MSSKILDKQGRWRNKTVAFRVSPEEDKLIETFVRLSGMSKEVTVVGNPKVYKALKNELASVLEELCRIKSGGEVSRDLLDTIELITMIMQGMKDE